MSEVFRQMPDSLLPYLTANNRLDMIDFMEAKMKAEVDHALEGTSQMTFLSEDSLSIKMNGSLRVDMRLRRVGSIPYICADSCRLHGDSLVVELTKTYIIKENQEERTVQYFSASWHPLSFPERIFSSLLKRDEEVFEEPHF